LLKLGHSNVKDPQANPTGTNTHYQKNYGDR
jgi:hypothetical protein